MTNVLGESLSLGTHLQDTLEVPSRNGCTNSIAHGMPVEDTAASRFFSTTGPFPGVHYFTQLSPVLSSIRDFENRTFENLISRIQEAATS